MNPQTEAACIVNKTHNIARSNVSGVQIRASGASIEISAWVEKIAKWTCCLMKPVIGSIGKSKRSADRCQGITSALDSSQDNLQDPKSGYVLRNNNFRNTGSQPMPLSYRQKLAMKTTIKM